MKTVLRLMWVLILIGCAMGSTGCGEDSSTQEDGDTGLSDGDESDAADLEEEGESTQPLDAVTGATPSGIALLDATHTGWENPACLSCHEKNPHQNDLPIAGCVACHGSNGAPERGVDHANDGCASCHAESHPALNFTAPGDCTSCHKYVQSDGCPATEEYDAVVIGAGGGGLAAATVLAKAGKRVILIEKHNKVGGYMTNFHRGPYTFEISLHAMGGFDDPNAGTAKMFKDLGIFDKVSPIRLDPGYRIVMPDMSLSVPADDEEYEQLLKEKFPDDAENIGNLFTYLREASVLFNELAAAKVAGGEVWEEFFAEHQTEVVELFGTMNITLSDFLKDYFTDQRLHMIFTQLASYVGASPDEVQAAFFMVMWFSYTFEGYYYFEGGSQSISDAMAEVITENGGTIKLNTLVTKIDVEDGKVTGVRTKNDACYRTNYVVSNAAAPTTLLEMVGTENLSESYAKKIQKMPVSVTAMVLYIGVDKDYRDVFQGAHEVFVNESYDQKENWEWFYSNNVDNAPYLLTNYSVLVDDIAPEGHNVLILAVYLDYDWNNTWHFNEDRAAYNDFREEIAQRFILRAEKILPGLSEHIKVLSIATPPTLERFTLNVGGTFYGFQNSPKYALLYRLEQETEIQGLYLAGQWTFPGPGQSAVMQSGQIAGNLVLKAMSGPVEPDGDGEGVLE